MPRNYFLWALGGLGALWVVVALYIHLLPPHHVRDTARPDALFSAEGLRTVPDNSNISAIARAAPAHPHMPRAEKMSRRHRPQRRHRRTNATSHDREQEHEQKREYGPRVIRRAGSVMLAVVTGGNSSQSRENRAMVLRTWFDKDVYMVTHEDVPVAPDNIVRLAPEAEAGGKAALPKKVAWTFAHLYEHYLDKYDWFMKVDDDTYVHTSRLRAVLSLLDPNVPLLLGRQYAIGRLHAGPTPLWGTQASPPFCHGGAGYIMSKALLRLVGPHFGKTRSLTILEDVATAGAIFRHSGVFCTNLNSKSYGGLDVLRNSHHQDNIRAHIAKVFEDTPAVLAGATTLHSVQAPAMEFVHAQIVALDANATLVSAVDRAAERDFAAHASLYFSAWVCTIAFSDAIASSSTCYALAANVAPPPRNHTSDLPVQGLLAPLAAYTRPCDDTTFPPRSVRSSMTMRAALLSRTPARNTASSTPTNNSSDTTDGSENSNNNTSDGIDANHASALRPAILGRDAERPAAPLVSDGGRTGTVVTFMDDLRKESVQELAVLLKSLRRVGSRAHVAVILRLDMGAVSAAQLDELRVLAKRTARGCAVEIFALRDKAAAGAGETLGTGLRQQYVLLQSYLRSLESNGRGQGSGESARSTPEPVVLVVPLQSFFQSDPFHMSVDEDTLLLFADGAYALRVFPCTRRKRFGPKYGVFRTDVLLGSLKRMLDFVGEALEPALDDLRACSFDAVVQARLVRSAYVAHGRVAVVSPWDSPVAQLSPVVQPRFLLRSPLPAVSGPGAGNVTGAVVSTVIVTSSGVAVSVVTGYRSWMHIATDEKRHVPIGLHLDATLPLAKLRARVAALLPAATMPGANHVSRDVNRVAVYELADPLSAETDEEVDTLHLLGAAYLARARAPPERLAALYRELASLKSRFEREAEAAHNNTESERDDMSAPVVFAYSRGRDSDCVASIFARFAARRGLRSFHLSDDKEDLIAADQRVGSRSIAPWADVPDVQGRLDVLFHPLSPSWLSLRSTPPFSAYLESYRRSSLGPGDARVVTMVREPLEGYFTHIVSSELAGRLQPFSRRAEGVKSADLGDLLEQFFADGSEEHDIQLMSFGLHPAALVLEDEEKKKREKEGEEEEEGDVGVGRAGATNSSREEIGGQFADFRERYMPRIDLILVYERLVESLVVLRRMLGWRVVDVLYLQRALRASMQRPASLKDAPAAFVERIRAATRQDQALYRASVERLDALVAAQGEGFSEEVAGMERALAALDATCGGEGAELSSSPEPAFCTWFRDAQRSPHRFVHRTSGVGVSVPLL